MKIKLVNDGARANPQVLLENGEPLEGVQRVQLDMDSSTRMPRAVVHLRPSNVNLDAQLETVHFNWQSDLHTTLSILAIRLSRWLRSFGRRDL